MHENHPCHAPRIRAHAILLSHTEFKLSSAWLENNILIVIQWIMIKYQLDDSPNPDSALIHKTYNSLILKATELSSEDGMVLAVFY